MKQIQTWNDLKEYGIIFLTGEACAYGIRNLCDLTEKGLKIIKDFFGTHMEITKGSNWNHSNGQVASIMLPRNILKDLATFCLIHEGAKHVVVFANGVGGLETKEDYEFYSKCKDVVRHVIKSNAPGKGDRNQHLMTGRTT